MPGWGVMSEGPSGAPALADLSCTPILGLRSGSASANIAKAPQHSLLTIKAKHSILTLGGRPSLGRPP